MAVPQSVSAEQLVKQVRIPSRPEVLIDVSSEAKKPDPSLVHIAEKLSSDVGLAGAILQVINSPLFNLPNKITSVQQACSLLGVAKVERVVTVVSMRNSVGEGLNLGRFWDSATEIANICGLVAPRLSGVSSDDAYTLGLFHDCGIPLMMQQFDDYKQTLADANREGVVPPTQLEDERYGINHCQVGFQLAQEWFLPDAISQAIHLHHSHVDSFTSLNDEDEDVITLIGILKMAEQISSVNRKAYRAEENSEWARIGDQVLMFLGMDEDDFVDFQDEIIEQLQALNSA